MQQPIRSTRWSWCRLQGLSAAYELVHHRSLGVHDCTRYAVAARDSTLASCGCCLVPPRTAVPVHRRTIHSFDSSPPGRKAGDQHINPSLHNRGLQGKDEQWDSRLPIRLVSRMQAVLRRTTQADSRWQRFYILFCEKVHQNAIQLSRGSFCYQSALPPDQTR